MQKIAIVITTISNGDFLHKFEKPVMYAAGRLDLTFYIVGDFNTPPSCRKKCAELNSSFMKCFYMTVEDQESFLRTVGFPVHYIPYRSDNRRNIGYLKAFEEHCDSIISMDDDNFPIDEFFFIQHAVTGSEVTAIPVASANRWVNPMSFLRTTTKAGDNITVYPRGFPYAKRWLIPHEQETAPSIQGTVGINVGLWTGDPDVDAITRLTTQCSSEPHKSWNSSNIYALEPGGLMPVNSQNTCLVREGIAAYYFLRMGYKINGMTMDRFGDIFSGYFLLLCNHAVGCLTTLGMPLVFQDRNEHDLLKDLSVELPGILIVEDLVPFLESALPRSGSYAEAYLHLTENLRQFISSSSKSKLWSGDNLVFINEITQVMSAWTDACKTLN